jgi:chromosome segregation ATPase
MSRSAYNRQSERFRQQLAEAKGKLESVAPDLGKLEQHLPRLANNVDFVRKRILEEQRESIDALIERAEERNGQMTRVILREWARGLLNE